ncbi:MAG: metal dependent phosphohydrolase, region with Response Regulator Receiver modulation [Anaerosporomusa subterranea]|nr:metal dependent phosphohydrolase, region with Response Regulator Receiver modulation [Anaerosporomusa subterranea]
MEKVLVVDDNPHNCELMSDLLTNWGYEVSTVDQGMEAIAVAGRDFPDIILLDVMLPGMNGFEVCHEIKTNPQTRDIPVIMLTVLNEVDDRIRGLKVGADYFMSKPFNYQELKFRLTALLQQKQRIDGMEEGQAVVDAFMAMMKLKDHQLYVHTCQVKEYCEKVSRVLLLSEKQHEQLLWAACLHDIGKVIDSSPSHPQTGREILSHLKMGSHVADLALRHHDPQPWISIELEILATVDCFVNLLSNLSDKQTCIEQLRQSSGQIGASAMVLAAIEQVLQDEQFLEKLTGRFK